MKLKIEQVHKNFGKNDEFLLYFKEKRHNNHLTIRQGIEKHDIT